MTAPLEVSNDRLVGVWPPSSDKLKFTVKLNVWSLPVCSEGTPSNDAVSAAAFCCAGSTSVASSTASGQLPVRPRMGGHVTDAVSGRLERLTPGAHATLAGQAVDLSRTDDGQALAGVLTDLAQRFGEPGGPASNDDDSFARNGPGGGPDSRASAPRWTMMYVCARLPLLSKVTLGDPTNP